MAMLVGAGVLLVAALVWGGATWLELRRVRARFRPVLDVEAEAQRILSDALTEVSRRTAEAQAVGASLAQLRATYQTAKATYDRLHADISALEQTAEDISVGLYTPHFDYETSEAFRAKLTSVRERQRSMVRNGAAVACGVAWTIGNSRREGERMQKQYSKLLLRAFNGECDAAVAKVAWDNVVKMQERIRKALDAINALGGVMQIRINHDYLDLKLDELRLEYELEDKKHREAEEQRRIREQMRDEERAQKELERAQREAEDEEQRRQKALDKARAELLKARGDEVGALHAKILKLEAALVEAKAQKERAKSMAEQTRSGWVYIISNHGSFGERVVKIGMTRRLDPMDRVRELGDASVPFEFDVHGMVHSHDAPALENALHRHFAQRRLNLVNLRKEFFEVALDEIQKYLDGAGHKLELTLAAEAREYRETLARREKATATASASHQASVAQPLPRHPATI